MAWHYPLRSREPVSFHARPLNYRGGHLAVANVAADGAPCCIMSKDFTSVILLTKNHNSETKAGCMIPIPFMESTHNLLSSHVRLQTRVQRECSPQMCRRLGNFGILIKLNASDEVHCGIKRMQFTARPIESGALGQPPIRCNIYNIWTVASFVRGPGLCVLPAPYSVRACARCPHAVCKVSDPPLRSPSSLDPPILIWLVPPYCSQIAWRSHNHHNRQRVTLSPLHPLSLRLGNFGILIKLNASDEVHCGIKRMQFTARPIESGALGQPPIRCNIYNIWTVASFARGPVRACARCPHAVCKVSDPPLRSPSSLDPPILIWLVPLYCSQIAWRSHNHHNWQRVSGAGDSGGGAQLARSSRRYTVSRRQASVDDASLFITHI
ncbi:hypothetical protein CBL_08121 [Carabus blaptoides fortunei]